MIHALSQIDFLASANGSVWHRASALGKLVLMGGLVLLTVFAPSLRLLFTVHLVAWLLALTSRVPLRLLAVAASYPLFFSLLFAAATWDGTWEAPLRLVLRPLTASLGAVWLVSTTPYPDLFAPLSRILPRRVADGLFVTYRALFDLMGRAECVWRSLRIRGGASVPARQRLTLAGEGLATLVLYGFERSQRLYATMMLRGHSGRICGCRHYADVSRADWLVAGVGGLMGAAALAWWRTR
jgi:energy-coupling factor transporter transmembrane protein EcfT